MEKLDPAIFAQRFVNEAASTIKGLPQVPRVLGIIASKDKPSLAYARSTKAKFQEIGIDYDLVRINRLDLENAIEEANKDPGIHGIFIYFPIFANQHDDYLRNLVDYRKDIEAGSHFWTQKLYHNDRYSGPESPDKKAVLPCTPLAIVKMLAELQISKPATSGTDRPERALHGITATIFNRSEVIGRPLAVMMSNDGARILSFDELGPLEFIEARPREITIDRQHALACSDIVITGVPNDSFNKVCVQELKTNAVCINFSSIANFAEDMSSHSGIYIPRIGPMTVAMCMRNTLRLFINFHLDRK
jgi:methylenetetrahydrofolate dehydrogenase (NADP+)/methenyltetrahydrofolate cyclohydrolase